MAECIEKKILLEAFKNVTDDPICPLHIAAEIYQILTEAPTTVIPEEPIATWVYEEVEDDDWGDTFPFWICSACGYTTGTNPTDKLFCPHCGKRIDLEDK